MYRPAVSLKWLSLALLTLTLSAAGVLGAVPASQAGHVELIAPQPQAGPPVEIPHGVEIPPGYAVPDPYAAAFPPGKVEVCCPAPKIRYRHHGRRVACSCACQETVETILAVPGKCCVVEVPVCVPACCGIVPQYKESRDRLGRCVYEYCWPCGFRARIVVRPLLGDLMVRTYND